MTQIEKDMVDAVNYGYGISLGNTKVWRRNGITFVIVKDEVIFVKKGDKRLYCNKGKSKLIDSRLKALGMTDETPMQNPLALQSIYNVTSNYGPKRRGYVVEIPGGKRKFFASFDGARQWADDRGYLVKSLF